MIFFNFIFTGPVQFEKDEEDPFGLDQFLDTAKRASGSNKRSNDDDRKHSDRDRKDNKRSRKDY
jgi:SNW domain-containing protein 1